MSGQAEPTLRGRIEALFNELRAAAAKALTRHPVVASKLDDLRGELERLLMLDQFEEREALHALGRAQLMLDAWRSMVSEPAVSRYVGK
jgi:hypothetical protein